MTVITSVDVSEKDFALGRAFKRVPQVTVEVEAIVPVASSVMPYFWIQASTADEVVAELSKDNLVGNVTLLDEVRSRQLVRIDWNHEDDELIGVLVDTNGVVLEAKRSNQEWTFRLRFADYDDLSMFDRRCRNAEIDLELNQVHSQQSVTQSGVVNLTPEQQEVLTTALDAGYFEVPRNTSLVDLGNELGISDSAASQRLRRGLATVLTNLDLASGD